MTKIKINANVDSDLKKDVDDILDELGLTPSAAITIFYKKIKEDGGIPFQLKLSDRQRNLRELQELAANQEHEVFQNKEERNKWLMED